MNGEETLIALRKLNLAIPVIISSGYDDSDLIERLKRLNNDTFLRKPYKAQELLQTVTRILG